MITLAFLIIGACGRKDSGAGSVPAVSAAAEIPQSMLREEEELYPGDDGRIVLKLASTLSPEMVNLSALAGFASEVSEATSGRVDVQIFPSSQLGDQVDYMNGIRRGTVEMCLISTAALESLDPHFVIFGMPGLFTTPEKVKRFYESDICRDILDRFRQDTGIRSLALFHDGIRNVWLKEDRVYRAEDFSGLRLRIPAEVEIRRTEFEALHADVVPLPLSECGIALQSGYIDGLENNVETIVNSDIAPLIGYQVKTEHAYSTLLLLINESALMQIDETDRNILTSAAKKYSDVAFRDYLKGQEEAYAAAEKQGISTIELEEKEKKHIRDIMLESTKGMLEGLFPEGFYETVRAQ
ncbi:MAG: TRAP transporter substrate-binding protein [Firmicutes bacterium]|nr:TRAP transporter substrate-binding protein [Bacillota bacterium]